MDHNHPLYQIRHSAAHITAQAVLRLWPGSKPTIGPVTEHGFFADLWTPATLSEADLPNIEEQMRKIIAENFSIVGRTVSKQEALSIYAQNSFKLEIINKIPENEELKIYNQGEYFDLCRGGHTNFTGEVKYFKLVSISGVYWKGDAKNPQLQRISGVAFETQAELDTYFLQLEQAKLYDHRLLGKNLELFTFMPEALGMAFWQPKGLIVYNLIITYMRTLLKKYAYQEVKTPVMLSCELWKTSGHYDNYRDNMFFVRTSQEEEYALRPMNCPCAALVYTTSPRSYRQLPLRLAEFGLVHRNELSGTLHGLFRARAFTQDDAHVFCTPDQILAEVGSMLAMVKEVFHNFNFENVSLALATRPEKSIGSDELWDKATQMLQQALDINGMPYTTDEGGGAFYGPKIDMHVKDSIGRNWQCGTIQIDFNLPLRFKLEYVASDQQFLPPVVIHRAILGSMERFIGILLEHTKGRLPFWLAPIQAKILLISDQQIDYAKIVEQKLLDSGLRVEIDESGEKINAKIRQAQLERTPWMIIIGAKEAESSTVSLRDAQGNIQNNIALDAIVSTLT